MSYPKPKSQAMLAELSRYVIAEPKPFVVDLAPQPRDMVGDRGC